MLIGAANLGPTRGPGRFTPLAFFASPRWTLVFFVFAAAASLAVAYEFAAATAVMPFPLGLLAINLIAAIATRPALRTDVPLLLLHLSLLSLLAFLLAGRLVYFDGSVTLSINTAFDGTLVRDERGPLHPDRLGELRFENAGFTERFPDRGHYDATYNRVRWLDEQGTLREAVIGDSTPLLLSGYRIYTSAFRGFTPIFHWQSVDGQSEYGAVQLNDTRMGDFAHSNDWRLPQGPELWTMIEFEQVDPPAGTQRQNLGVDRLAHHLVVRLGEERHNLRLGDSLTLPEGRLTYVRLDSWMGYRLVYDPSQPWVLASVIVAVSSLLWYYLRKFRARTGNR